MEKTIRRILVFFILVIGVFIAVAVDSVRNINRSVASSDWVAASTGASGAAFVKAAFAQVLGRAPTAEEQARCERFLTELTLDPPDATSDQAGVPVATGRYLGEGFDDARLDTLFLTMPISWRGTLALYADRLHRLHPAKRQVVIFDNLGCDDRRNSINAKVSDLLA